MVKKHPPHRPFFKGRHQILICLCLVLTTLAVYWQVRHHDFVDFDDDLYVTQNRNVKNGLTVDSVLRAFVFRDRANQLYWQPLTWLSHMLDVELFGLSAGKHHLSNLLFHIANTLLLFWVLRRMTGAVWRSAFVAGLFGLHPLNVESVAWIAERKNVLSTFFWLLTMWAYVNYVKKPALLRYLLALLTFILGLMTKPMLVTLPFVLLLLDYWPLERIGFADRIDSDKRNGSGGQGTATVRLIGEKVPFLLFSAIAVWATSRFAQTAEQVPPFGLRMANALVTYLKYIIKTIWPQGLAVLYPYPGQVPAWKMTGALIVLAGLTVLVLKTLKSRPYLGIGWFWYLGTLVPVIGLVQSGMWPEMADRWAYVPLIGFFIMIAWGVPDFFPRWRHKKIWLASLAVTALLAFAGITFLQVTYWQNSMTLYQHAIRVTSGNAVIYNNLGYVLAGQGRPDEATRYYQEALRIRPGYAKARNNLGDALAKQGRLDEAIRYYQETLRIKPEYAEAHNSLGIALLNQGKLAEAIDHFQKALQLKPDLTLIHNNLGMAYARQGRFDEAIAHYQSMLRDQPDNATVYLNIGNAFTAQGLPDKAIVQYQEALRLKPGYALAHKNLGIVLARKGDMEEALEHLERALQLNPNDGELRQILQQALRLRQQQ